MTLLVFESTGAEHIRLLSTRATRATRLYDRPFGAMAQEERSKSENIWGIETWRHRDT
jgi:hypothetical protein